jgi:starch-binding outer membrane protein SusE/F
MIMKNIFKSLLFITLAVTFFSCEKDENQVVYQGGTAPVLSAKSTTIPLSFANKDQTAIVLNWTNPNYKFTTGVSSQNVTYRLEIDTLGANFTNPKRQTFTVANDLGKTFTQNDFNDFLLNQLQLTPGVPHKIEIRVTATLGSNNSVPLSSNVLSYTVTPYAIPPKVAPPSTGKLFITGSATPASWQCGCGEAELASQRFTQVSPTLYTLTINLNGGGSYLFLPQYGSWSAKYGAVAPNNTNNVNGDDFRDGGNDMKAPDASGLYRIEVDFQRGKFTVTKV